MARCRIGRAAFMVWLVVAIALATTWAFGHLCNNIYNTPDRVIVKPEKPTATVVGNEEFRVFVQNNYPTFLDNLRLAGKVDGGAVTVQVTPESVKRLKAGERFAFKVKLTSPPGARQGRYALAFSISADNIGWKPVAEAKAEDLKYVLKHGDNLSATIQAAESLVTRREAEGTAYLSKIAANRASGADYQARALRALGKGGDKKNLPFVRTMLQQQDGFVKGNALLALGLLGDRAATFEPYYQDRDQFVAAAAMAGRVLAGGREAKVLSALAEDLKSSNVYVRIAAGWALAGRRDKAGIAALDQAFSSTDDGQQRTTAGDAMVEIANRR